MAIFNLVPDVTNKPTLTFAPAELAPWAIPMQEKWRQSQSLPVHLLNSLPPRAIQCRKGDGKQAQAGSYEDDPSVSFSMTTMMMESSSWGGARFKHGKGGIRLACHNRLKV